MIAAGTRTMNPKAAPSMATLPVPTGLVRGTHAAGVEEAAQTSLQTGLTMRTMIAAGTREMSPKAAPNMEDNLELVVLMHGPHAAGVEVDRPEDFAVAATQTKQHHRVLIAWKSLARQVPLRITHSARQLVRRPPK